MDGLSIAANVAAVVTIALQTTKLVYGTIAEIKNGPDEVTQLASALTDLECVLRQIRDIVENSSDDHPPRLERLKLSAEEGAAALKNLDAKIMKLRGSSISTRIGRAWSSVKIFVRKEDLHNMREVVKYHSQKLGFQLDVAQL
jgi:hypothetical protein